MKPRASAPSTRSGSSGLANAASSSPACRSASGSARRGMMSLKTIPSFGKSGMSRIFDARSTAMKPRRLDQRAEGAPEQELRELLGRGGERLEVLEAREAPLRVPGAKRRRDDLLQEAGC